MSSSVYNPLTFQWQLAALNMLFAMKKYEDLESLCRSQGFNAETLAQTLDDVSRVAGGESTDRFGKPCGDSRELKFPLYVIDVSLDAKLLPCTVMTMGGLVVNEETGQVVAEGGDAVPGLYAAGRTAVGIPSHRYMSGLSIADCVFSGRRAADHLAA